MIPKLTQILSFTLLVTLLCSIATKGRANATDAEFAILHTTNLKGELHPCG